MTAPAYARGTVVVAADPFGRTPRRPYLVVSDDSHPFAGEQYIGLGITTKEYEASLPLAGRFRRGRLNRESFVSPWAVVSLRDVDVDRAVARTTGEVVDSAVDRLRRYVVGDGGEERAAP
ncbi:hypothetical protein [Halobaculum sp. EA56]|uniref:hypothetical protein n=1 Tax=Halobaculum sp. EA56 TaxID=3421648 RepID=UPI003EC10397